MDRTVTVRKKTGTIMRLLKGIHLAQRHDKDGYLLCELSKESQSCVLTTKTT